MRLFSHETNNNVSTSFFHYTIGFGYTHSLYNALIQYKPPKLGCLEFIHNSPMNRNHSSGATMVIIAELKDDKGQVVGVVSSSPK